MRLRKWFFSALSCLLAVVMVLGLFGISPATVQAETDQADVVPVDLGAPVQTAQAIDAEFGQEDGVNVAYMTVTGSASAGDYATFSVLDIDHEELLRKFPLEGASNAWSHVMTPDGRVFIGASNKMFVYSPVTKQVTDLGVPLPGTSSIWALTADDEGNVYGGIYSESVKGRVFRIDAETLAITDLLNGPVDSNEAYIRSIGYYNGYIYAGTGSKNGRVWKISAASPLDDQTRLELPGTPEDPVYAGKYNAMAFVYGINIHENYLFAFYNGPLIMQVYDLEAQEWTGATFANIRGVEAATGYKDGKVYTSKKDGKMWEIDLATMTEKPVMDFDANIRNSQWIPISGQPDFPDGAMASISFNARVMLMDPQRQLSKTMKLLVEGQGINIQAMETGPDGKIYISTYLNSEGAQYDPATGKTTVFPLAQSEGIGHVGNTMYFGIYPHAEVAAWDTTTPLPINAGPQSLFHIGEEQDRPFVVTEGGGKLLLGTIPTYGQTGGALTVYDPAASAEQGEAVYEVFRNVVQDQSITGLLYKDGLVYGSTSISGGLGDAPAGTRAKLFVWDMATKTKLYEWEPELDDLSSLQMISGLALGSDGLIWAAANGIVFAFDPDTREIVKSRNIHPDIRVYGKWRPVHQRFSSDGLLYSDAGGKLVVIDPETMAYKIIKDEAALFTLDHNDNLYVAEATNVLVYPPFAKPVEAEQPQGPVNQYLPLVNPGFEDALNADGSIPGWTVTASTYGYSSVEVTSENKKSGNNSVKLVDGSTSYATELMSDPVAVIPGREYKVNFNMHLNGSFPRPAPGTGNFSSSRSSVGIRYFDAEGKQFTITSADNKHVDGPQLSWIPIEMTTVVPATAVSMRLVVFVSPLWVASVYYDEVSAYTVVDPSEIPQIKSAQVTENNIKEGENVTIEVKATDQAEIVVKDGDAIVARGVGAGDTSVAIVIPKPAAGVHHYTVTAEVPLLISSEAYSLPEVTVHGFTGYRLNSEAVTLQVGNSHTVVTQAVYGALAEDVSAMTVLSTNAPAIVKIQDNLITAVRSGVADVTVSILGEELTLKVTVQAPSAGGPAPSQKREDDSGLEKGQQAVTAGQLQPENGKATVTLLEGRDELVLPLDIFDQLAGNALEIVKNGVALTLPADILKDAAEQAPGVKQIHVRLRVMNDEDGAAVLNRISGHAAKALDNGYVVDLDISVLTEEGMQAYGGNGQFDSPVKVAFEIPEGAAANLLGVYYIDPDGNLEFVGGVVKERKLLAELHHFSDYAVLEWSKTYADVSPDHWASMAIRSLTAKHVIAGTSETRYSPDAVVTRAQFVTMLVNAFGLAGQAKTAAPFVDVANDAWYYDAVAIASSSGIVSGTDAGRFEPDSAITREQMAAMLVRTWEAVNGPIGATTAELSFKDKADVSAWALAAVKIAVAQGWIHGQEGRVLAPSASATRAESAVMLYNMLAEQYQ